MTRVNTQAPKEPSLKPVIRTAHWLAAKRSIGDISSKLPPLFYFTDETRLPDPRPILEQLPKGCGVIFRHYEVENRASLASDCRKICARQKLPFLVAGDIQLARKLKADGFHAPEYMLSQRSRLKALSPTWLTTTSVHSKQALLKAQKAGLDAAFASPVFATKSHPGSPHLGLNRLRTWALDSQMPLYALGGINRQNHAELRTSYVAGLAGIGLLQET